MATKRVDGFFGNYRFLSNFPECEVELDEEIYPTVEHAYQAAKTLDPWVRRLIRNALTPGQAKRIGIVTRLDWHDIKIEVMRELLMQKFSQPEFMHMLLGTGDLYLEETNTWNDTFWGVCRGVGENHLGLLLMEIREHLREIGNVAERPIASVSKAEDS